MAAVVDDGVQRRKADAAGDEQKIFPGKVSIDREAVAVRAADGDLLARLHRVQPRSHAAAFFDGELHKLGVCGRGCNGKHRLAYTGN